jgi:hypothetical protein
MPQGEGRRERSGRGLVEAGARRAEGVPLIYRRLDSAVSLLGGFGGPLRPEAKWRYLLPAVRHA